MIQRILWSCIAIPVIIFLLFLPSKIPFFLVGSLVFLIALYEFFKMMENASGNISTLKFIGILSAIFILFYTYKNMLHLAAISFVFFLVLAIIIKTVSLIFPTKFTSSAEGIQAAKPLDAEGARKDAECPAEGTAESPVRESVRVIEDYEVTYFKKLISVFVTFFGVFYIAIFGSYIISLLNLKNGVYIIFFLLVIVWTADSGAYFFGKLFGKRRVFPSISPTKTLEGYIFGIGSGILGSLISKLIFPSIFSFSECVTLGFLIATIGQFGDLFESMLKRFAGVKNSFNLIPEHGGMLDKIDSLLFAGIFMYFYIKYL